jgi:hypothetical protein
MFAQYRSRFDSYTPQQRSEIGKRAAVGLLGLILGLFIGWVVWPLDERGAGVEDLAPELQARYLSAVADAYVATQDSATALARLADFSNPEQALVDAIRYHQLSGAPNSAIRQLNLRALATAVGAGESVAQALQADAPPGLASPSPLLREPAVGWLSWLLVLLTAILLIVGGGWIGIQLMRKRMHAPRDVRYRRVERPAGPDFDPVWEPQMSESQRLAAWQFGTVVEDEVDAEDRTNAGGSNRTTVIDAQPERPGRRVPPPPVVLEVDHDTEAERERDFDDGSWEDEDTYDDEPYDEDADGEEPYITRSYSIPFEEDEDEAEQEADWEDEEEVATEELIFSPPVEAEPAGEEAATIPPAPAPEERPVASEPEATPPAEPPPLPPIIPPTSAPQERSKRAAQTKGAPAGRDLGRADPFHNVINNFWRKETEQSDEDILVEHVAHYQRGITDYDESFIITTPGNENERVGACGMGSSAELDPRSISNDEVRLLDVWFYDRDDYRSLNQLIVSPGSNMETLAEQFHSSGTVTGGPLVAEPGTTFLLQGKRHFVTCRIEEVSYQQKGDPPVPFERVKVRLTVLRKRK